MHQRLFAPTHYPRLLRLIVSEGRTMGRRYQIVLVHSFEDAWDLELETIEARAEALARRGSGCRCERRRDRSCRAHPVGPRAQRRPEDRGLLPALSHALLAAAAGQVRLGGACPVRFAIVRGNRS